MTGGSERSCPTVFARRFLRQPERFPASSDGEAWGGREILLGIAGGTYRLEGLAASQLREIEHRLGERVPEAAGPGVSSDPVLIRVRRIEDRVFRTFDRRGWEMTVDRDPAPETVRLAGWRFQALLEQCPRLRATLWTSVGEGPELHGVFENFLRVLVAYRLLEVGGTALHSAGIAGERGAHLFLGPSGAGKTTLSRRALEAGAEVLSDDLNAALPATPGGGAPFLVERLPFAGDLGQTSAPGQRLPLAGLHRLAQGDEAGWEPLSRARALAALVACCPFVNTDPHRQEELERVLLELLSAVPVGTLTFPRRVEFRRVLDLLETELARD